jgi:hypothetical protein
VDIAPVFRSAGRSCLLWPAARSHLPKIPFFGSWLRTLHTLPFRPTALISEAYVVKTLKQKNSRVKRGGCGQIYHLGLYRRETALWARRFFHEPQ